MNLPPEIYIPLMLVFRLAHIFGAVIWLGFALYGYFVTSRIDQSMSATSINYQLGIAKHTQFGQLMSISAITTTLAGILLWGINGAKYGTGLGVIILGIGTLVGLVAFGHSFGVGKRNDALAKALLAAEKNGAVDPSKHADIGAMIAKLSRMSNISMGLMVVTLVCMVSYSQF